MGLFDFLKKVMSGGEESDGPNMKGKCPKCGTEVNLSMKRCPGCGTHTDLLFRIKCPECGTVNELKNRECKKCKTKLREDSPDEGTPRQMYICPICRYKADYYMLKCPACGTRFA